MTTRGDRIVLVIEGTNDRCRIGAAASICFPTRQQISPAIPLQKGASCECCAPSRSLPPPRSFRLTHAHSLAFIPASSVGAPNVRQDARSRSHSTAERFTQQHRRNRPPPPAFASTSGPTGPAPYHICQGLSHVHSCVGIK